MIEFFLNKPEVRRKMGGTRLKNVENDLLEPKVQEANNSEEWPSVRTAAKKYVNKFHNRIYNCNCPRENAVLWFFFSTLK
jgi:hypothetical protein